ncbi:MAG: hypothetical protein CFE43_02175 [Burkholderiales bacterium PBB3]|nr:MAG: hypothetical protein CFE43_02175 [Burkholderiales bacterium PBB3]
MEGTVDLEALLNEQEEEIYVFLYDELSVPESIAPQDIAAHFFSLLASSSVDGSEISKAENDEFESANATFELVCRSVPNVPVRCLQVISLALGGIAACKQENGRFREGNDEEVIRTLMTASYALGIAKTTFKPREIQSSHEAVFRKRKHHIHHAINVAKKRSSDLNDSGSVWAELTSMAKQKSHALLGVTTKGIQYLDANDEPKEFSKKQLTVYLEGSNLQRNRPRKSA